MAKNKISVPEIETMNHSGYTRFGKARVVGARALQISKGAPPLIDTEEMEALKIAKQEFEEQLIPIAIRRPEPGSERL